MEPILKNRKRFTSSIKNELAEAFNQLAHDTRIPKSRLFDEAIEDLLKKYRQKNLKKIIFYFHKLSHLTIWLFASIILG